MGQEERMNLVSDEHVMKYRANSSAREAAWKETSCFGII